MSFHVVKFRESLSDTDLPAREIDVVPSEPEHLPDAQPAESE